VNLTTKKYGAKKGEDVEDDPEDLKSEALIFEPLCISTGAVFGQCFPSSDFRPAEPTLSLSPVTIVGSPDRQLPALPVQQVGVQRRA